MKMYTSKMLALIVGMLCYSSIFAQTTITVDPSDSNQSVIFGGDSKLKVKDWAEGDTTKIAQKLFVDMDLKILRVPIFALQPITDPIYDNVITVIKSVQSANPDVKIFASIANGDGYGTDYHGEHKFPASMRGCCAYNVYSLNLTAYAAYLDSFMDRMSNAGIYIDYLGPWNEDNADDSDHKKVFDQMTKLGTTQTVGLERWGLLTSVADVDDVEDRVDIIGSHFYDDENMNLADWQPTWASLVTKSSQPVWYTESTRYTTSDGIDKLVAGMNNIFPAMNGGAEAVLFYQAVKRFVWANGGTSKIKYTGFQNIVNNSAGKVMTSSSNNSDIRVVAFGGADSIDIHITNTGTSSQTASIQLQNGYKASGDVVRTIWTATDTATVNQYYLGNNASWNVTVPATSYSHLKVPLNNTVASRLGIPISESSLENMLIYPNPLQGSNFTLSMPAVEGAEKAMITLSDVRGRTLLQVQKDFASKISLDKLNLSEGLYFVAVKAGEKTFRSKLVVQ